MTFPRQILACEPILESIDKLTNSDIGELAQDYLDFTLHTKTPEEELVHAKYHSAIKASSLVEQNLANVAINLVKWVLVDKFKELNVTNAMLIQSSLNEIIEGVVVVSYCSDFSDDEKKILCPFLYRNIAAVEMPEFMKDVELGE